jgi:hypothetical protein
VGADGAGGEEVRNMQAREVGCPCGRGVGGTREKLEQRKEPEGGLELLIPCRELGNTSHPLWRVDSYVYSRYNLEYK